LNGSLYKGLSSFNPLYEEEGLVEMNLGEFEGMEAQQWFVEYSIYKALAGYPGIVSMPGGENSRRSRQGHPNTGAHHEGLSK